MIQILFFTLLIGTLILALKDIILTHFGYLNLSNVSAYQTDKIFLTEIFFHIATKEGVCMNFHRANAMNFPQNLGRSISRVKDDGECGRWAGSPALFWRSPSALSPAAVAASAMAVSCRASGPSHPHRDTAAAVARPWASTYLRGA